MNKKKTSCCLRYALGLGFIGLSGALAAEDTAADNDDARWFAALQDGWAGGEWRFRTSLYTTHYNPKPEHQNHQKLLGVEYRRDDAWLVGSAYFRNSFNQPTVYLYVGREWMLWQHADWRLRGTITGGLLHGYRGEYRDKIPLNRYGVAPVLLPSLALDYRHIFAELQFFAASGLLVAAGFRYPVD